MFSSKPKPAPYPSPSVIAKGHPLYAKIDQTKLSEFGRQVLMLLRMNPGEWALSPSGTLLRHAAIGVITIGADGHCYHNRSAIGPGDFADMSTQQRFFTKADSAEILQEVAILCVSAIPLAPTPPLSGAAIGAGTQSAPMAAMRPSALAQISKEQIKAVSGIAKEQNRPISDIAKELGLDSTAPFKFLFHKPVTPDSKD